MRNLINKAKQQALKIPGYIAVFFLMTVWHTPGIIAQPISRYNTFSYNVNEGLLQSTISNIAVDKNNFCWISFPNGIQRFDGNNFFAVNVQPGLPDDKHAKLFRCKDGELLISHSKGISKYDIEKDGFTHVYKQDSALQRPVIFLGEDEGIVYFYDENASISGMECKTFTIVNITKTGLSGFSSQSQNTPGPSKNIVDHKTAFWFNNTICLWDLKNKRLIYQSPPIPDSSPYFLRLLANNKVLYTSYADNNMLQCWDINTSGNKKILIEGKDKTIPIFRLVTIQWKGKYLAAINDRLYEADSNFSVLTSELVNFQNKPVAGGSTIADIIEDDFGNIYVQTVTSGIRKIIRKNYPFRYYGSPEKEHNHVTSIFADKDNNRIFMGTAADGLFIFDTLQQLVKHIQKISNSEIHSGITSIIKDPTGDYLLFVRGEKKIWRLRSNLSSFTSYPIQFSDTPSYPINYFGSPLYQDKESSIVQSMYQLFRTYFGKAKTTAHYISGEYTLGRLWYDNKIIYHTNNDLVFLDDRTFKEIKKIPFPNTGGVRCLEKDNQGHLLLGTNKGIFKIDTNGNILRQWNKENGLADDCIYAIVIDKSGHLWCSSNKGIFRIDTNNNILQFTKEDGLQENEFNTGVAVATPDGELFFGGMNGVSSFYPSSVNSYDEKINILLTRIRVNNKDFENGSAVWNISTIKLPYNQNSLSFDFVAMANNNPSQYIYQYKMKGLDNEWLQSNGVQTIRYSLPPGKYTLQLYASRSFEKDAKPMKEIQIIIRPPFWKTWWFFTALGLLIFLLVIYGVNQGNKRKYAEKLQQLENERQIKMERERISKDLHDNLGAYANAVLYKTEQLEKEEGGIKKNALIADLKFASKDIITSLRETVWALKKESYTAEDCLLRIRNFIQPFIRYYEHIQFRVTGEAPAGKTLHYTKALNLVRIVQEAVSNSIRHAGASQIIVSSEFRNNKWKIEITDNGKGFDQTIARKEEQGNGLYNMEYRAAAAGFEWSINAEKDAGTTITIII